MDCKILYQLPYHKVNCYYALARDDVLFSATQKFGVGHIGLLSYSSKSYSLGYFQKHSQLKNIKSRNITRRITGGGVVHHKDDLILSLSYDYNLNSKDVTANYKMIHTAIMNTLKEFGIDCELYESSIQQTKSKSYSCFVSPVKYDILSGSFKIAGGAMARKNGAFLYQGSIQSDIIKRSLKSILCFRNRLFVNLATELQFLIKKKRYIKNEVEKEILAKVHSKYRNKKWIRKY